MAKFISLTKNIDIVFGAIDGMSLKTKGTYIVSIFGYGTHILKNGDKAIVIILSFFRIIYYKKQ